MKSVIEGQCGQQNALVGLANTFGTSNQRVAPSSASSSILPSSSLGEQMANEFLRAQSQTAAPSSFSMKSLQHNLPQASSSSSLALNWSNEFQPRQNQLAHQWAQQYSSPSRVFETAWQSSTPTISSSSTAPQISGMWSSEFLDNAEKNLQQSSSSLNQFDDFVGSHNEMYDNIWEEIKEKANIEAAEESNEYIYQESNPFIQNSNPLNDGDLFMRQGDVGNAMLAYEAAVTQNPQDAKGWCRLGLAHAENEKDERAIQAFKKCLEIEPNNREAILSLSVSLANEGLENEALHQLDKWISVYNGNETTQIDNNPPIYSSFLVQETFKRVEQRFLNAAQQQGSTPDPDLQNALGILYNLNRNFLRAVDSLKLALAKNPDDARLWNRLGATLANGDRSAEAISAYREALSRYPTYVRARYNLGISCMQLQSYREALNHFLSAVELQKGGNEASTIWASMRSAAIRIDNSSDDLLKAVEMRDLSGVKMALQAAMP